MKMFLLLLLGLVSLSAFAQVKMDGIWQGLIVRDGAKWSESSVLFLEINTADKNLTGRTREEVTKSDCYMIQKIKGTITDSVSIKFKQYITETKKTTPKITWIPFEAKLSFDTLTGYLSGSYTQLAGRKTTGKITMYRSTAEFSNSEMIMLHQSWRDVFIQDLNQKRKAPAIREWERKNFLFEPIYFDYDRDSLKVEYNAYLKEMVRVVLDHTDLRIKITGHTDADGSTAYNKELSERRAKSIQDFFVKCGLPPHKVVTDFKGEEEPVDNNKTDNGKQRNRRVDFTFI
jgi:outer membrane protein OmpA-like peptidoglycan-associated protein